MDRHSTVTALTALTTADPELARLRRAGDHPLITSFPNGALVVFDHDLRYVTAGGLGLEGVGLSSEALVGRTIQEVFPPDVVAVIRPHYLLALRGEESTLDVPYAGRVYVQRLGPVRDRRGRIIAGIGFTQDVTTVRETERSLRASQERLREEHRRLVESQAIGRVGSWEWDLRSDTMVWSDSLLALYGLDIADFDGDYAGALECIDPDDRATVDAATTACLAGAGTFAVRYRVTRFDTGELRWFDARGQLLREGDTATRLAGAVADVTEQVQAEQQARDAEAFQNAVLAASPDLALVLEAASGRVVYASRESGMLGVSANRLMELDSRSLIALVHPQDQIRFRGTEGVACSLEDGEVLQHRHRGRSTDGSWRWLSRRVTPFRRDSSGQVLQLLAVIRDVTETVEFERRMTHAALHDALTGLPNRALLIDRLNAAMSRATREGRELTVLFCDLDGFKRINDTFGHAVGDAVLVETAGRISGLLRQGDTVARVGGDEFVVVVEPWNRAPEDASSGTVDGDCELAERVGERIADAVRVPVVVDGVEHVVTASIGIAHRTSQSMLSANQLVQDADAAMYRAKRRGRDRIETFELALRGDLAEAARVERLLRAALLGTSGPAILSTAFQPIIGPSGRLHSLEALARLHDERGTEVAPDVLIAVAEDTGQIGALGRVVLEQACRQLAAWRLLRPALAEVTMSVNISAFQAQHGSLENDVRGALAAHGLHPRDLTLELTETVLLEAGHTTLSALRGLRDDGMGIAIDDFGTGYASLRSLTSLPVSAVKVDRSFAAGLPDDTTSVKIVNAVAGLAADLDLLCVVEGVETEEQRSALPERVHLQGSLLGQPLPGHALEPLLDRWLPVSAGSLAGRGR